MDCQLCPRRCGVQRPAGFCHMGDSPRVARAALHMWEEPCISGEQGSGTVFFSGCSLRCVFCQNRAISEGGYGKDITVEQLREIFEELIANGAENINLVNPTHYVPAIAAALEKPLPVPVVYNTGGYDRVETLRLLEGKVQVYLPDMKYALSKPATRYSGAADYPDVARAAILEMVRQTGPYRLNERGMLNRGVLIRHLILPRNLENTRRVIDWVASFPQGEVLFSLMSQYTPCGDLSDYPEINRRLTKREQEAAETYLFASGIEDGFLQERESACVAYIPAFDLTGVDKPCKGE